MDRTEVPDWKDMPRDTPIAILCWQDIYLTASDDLERNPTKKEVKDLFEETHSGMRTIVGDSFSNDLMDVMSYTVPQMLKEKKYNTAHMSDEELLFDKYCHECKEVQKTYWEENYCSKNPKALDIARPEHGNDDTCEDGYCSPESRTVKVSAKYVEEHAVYERCAKCHQYFDSGGSAATL